MNWGQLQSNSEKVLASGIHNLTRSKGSSILELVPLDYGNYLIYSGQINYIGESKNVSRRLVDHSKEDRSTFFKNYKKFREQYLKSRPSLKIGDFKAKQISTVIGRKEMEEFGIVNIPTCLNRFQLDKRSKYRGKALKGIWTEVQEASQDLLLRGEKSLLRRNPEQWFKANPESVPGIYWAEHPKHGLIYIGESSDVRSRWLTHSGDTYFSALRRHIGENILGFQLKTKKGKKRYFTDTEDRSVTSLLQKIEVRLHPVSFGRYELEEFLIRKHKPLLNRKENK
jgi:predicted GIY-YIG superfamily endonuclease